MPYVLKQIDTAEVFTCSLINIYDFPYHGVKVWNSRSAAETEYASFLVEKGIDDLWNWELAELEEALVKIGNVKLNNNAAKRLFLTPEGKLQAR